MNSFDTAYLDILGDVMDNGVQKGDRTGTGTISRFGTQTRFNLKDNRLPLLSLRKVFHRSFIHETLWFLSGSTDIGYLKDNNVSIWDSWVKPGTERYRDMTHEELRDATRKLVIENPQLFDEAFDDVSFNLPKAAGASNELRVSFKDCGPNNIYLVLTYVEPYMLKFYYEELKNKVEGDYPSTKILVGGSIGTGAYGSQWRRWEDTRVIRRSETKEYLDRGFEYVGEVAHSGDPIVHRSIDQIANIVELLRTNPDSRRILLIAFNPAKVDECQLPPCHFAVQWWTRVMTALERTKWQQYNATEAEKHLLGKHIHYLLERASEDGLGDDQLSDEIHRWHDEHGTPERALSCMLYMRSSDYPVGAVFNIPQYALLTHMLAQVTGMVAEELVFTGADTHAYSDQIDGVLELLQREGNDAEARVLLNPDIRDIDDFIFEDIAVTNYEHDPVIRFPVAV